MHFADFSLNSIKSSYKAKRVYGLKPEELWKILVLLYRLWEANVVMTEETGTEQRSVFHYLAVSYM